jgi:cysteine synthase
VSRYIKLTQGKAIQTIAVEPEASPLITQALQDKTSNLRHIKFRVLGLTLFLKT